MELKYNNEKEIIDATVLDIKHLIDLVRNKKVKEYEICLILESINRRMEKPESYLANGDIIF